jgi:PKD repeat protein
VDLGADAQTFDFTGDVTQESGNEHYNWSFGDASTATDYKEISHTFPGSGPYTVTLTVHDPDVTPDRTATVTIAPTTLTPITPQAPPPPSTPPTRMLSPPYCYYVNQVVNAYMMVFVALWRMNPRDGVWWDQYVIGPVPMDPTTGDPSVDPGQWGNQQPTFRSVATQPDETGPGV